MKIWQKTIAVLATFALLINSLVAPFSILAQSADESPIPTSEPNTTSVTTIEPTATPVETATGEPTVMPSESATPTPTSIPSESATPTPTDQPTETKAPESSPTVQGPPSSTEPISTPTTTPTITPQASVEKGHISATVLENTKVDASEMADFDLMYQEDGSATISTDKLDYAPTDTAIITGVGFIASKTYTIYITSSDEPAVEYSASVIANEKGEILHSYTLDGNYRPNYKVVVKDGERLIASTTFTDSPVPTPSTNDINQTNGWAHVDQLSLGVGTTDLQFISTRNFASCFEYRTDGNTSQKISNTNYNTNITDGLYPFHCENNSSETFTIPASHYVEVRMVFGGEGDERFDWTRFNVTPNTSGFVFVGNPKYVRASNAGDESARILVSSETTDTRFFVDGSVTPISGIFVGPSTSTTEWWGLKTALTAGEHTITAQVELNEIWYDISESGIAFSIDLPWAEYVIPQTNQYFRANDKIIRIRADDEFNQFDHMVTKINGVNYTVNRSSCTDQGNNVLCDLQNLNLPEGTYTATTTTYTKANNRVDNLVSQPFTIDGTLPILSNFIITDVHTIYKNNVIVSANASDGNGIKNVTFYLTTPRVSDGVCDGNGTQLSNVQGILTSGAIYTATLNSSGLNGDYCLNAIAEDMSANHSSPILHIKAIFDNTAPATPTLESPIDGVYRHTSDSNYSDWSDVTDISGVTYRYQSAPDTSFTTLHYDSMVNGASPGPLTESMIMNPNEPEVTYYWRVQACDGLNNCSAWTTPWQINIDNTKPTTPVFYSPANNTISNINSVTVKWNGGDDSGSGIKGYIFRYVFYPSNGGPQINWSSGFVNTVAKTRSGSFGHGQGLYEMYVKVVDVAGNESTESNFLKITYDITSPSTPTGIYFKDTVNNKDITCGGITSARNFDVYWNTNPETDIDYYEYISFNADGSTGPIRTFTTPYFNASWWTAPIEGTYGVQVRAVDKAGNRSGWYGGAQGKINSCKYTTDWTAPLAPTISDPLAEQAFKVQPILNKWSAVSDTSGIKEYRIEYIYDDGHTFSGGPYRITTSTQRNHVPSLSEQSGVTIRVQAIDNAGNFGAWSTSVHYYYDATAPTGSWVTPTNGSTVSGVVTLNFNAIDGTYGSGIESIVYSYSDDNVNFTNLSSNLWDTTALPLGDYILRATVTDNAGNTATFDETVGVSAIVSSQSAVSTSYSEAVITWITDKPTTSRVVYDTVGHDLGVEPNYGYIFSTVEDTNKVTSHSVTLTGLTAGVTYYYRVISHGSPITIGGEGTFNVLSVAGAPAPSGNAGGAVLGLATSATLRPTSRFTSEDTGNEGDVLGAETSETATPVTSFSPTTEIEKVGIVKWVMTHKKISLGIFILLIILIYLLTRKKKVLIRN